MKSNYLDNVVIFINIMKYLLNININTYFLIVTNIKSHESLLFKISTIKKVHEKDIRTFSELKIDL